MDLDVTHNDTTLNSTFQFVLALKEFVFLQQTGWIFVYLCDVCDMCPEKTATKDFNVVDDT